MGMIIGNAGMDLLPLSWKWYFFGLCLFGLYLWHRQRRLLETKAGRVNIRLALLRTCGLGIVLALFAFIVAPRTKWVFVGAPFALTTVVGWAIGFNEMKGLQTSGSVTAGDVSNRRMLFAILGGLALGIAAMMLPRYGDLTLLAIWGGCAGFLVGLGISAWALRPTQFLSRTH